MSGRPGQAHGFIVEMEDLRRHTTAVRGRSRRAAAAELAAAIVEALPALLEAARVVGESGDWVCEDPVPRVARGGEIAEWEPCGRCLSCRMDAAQQRLSEVEL